MGLFARYEASAGAIRGAASDLISGSTQVERVKSSVMQQQQTSASAVSGMLLGPLTSSVQPVVSTAASAAQAATIASGALDLFAKAVDEYNEGIDRLNERYEAAVASNFGVVAPPIAVNGGPGLTAEEAGDQFHDAVVSAGAALRAELVKEKRKLKELLDSGAETVAAVLNRGPSEAALLVLALNGALPALASVNFPSFKDSKYVFDRAMQLNGLVGLGKKVVGVRNKLAFDRAALALLQGKNLSNAELRAVVQIAGGNMDDLRVINQIARRTEDLAPLRAAVAAGTDFDLLGAAAATSKFSKVLGAAGILGAGYDIFANPGDHHGARRTADLVADGAGITAGVGAIALGTGMVAAGTAAAAVLAPVVLVAGTAALAYGVTTFVVDNWGDDIASGLKTADAWVNDQVDHAVDATVNFAGDRIDEAGEVIGDAADWAEDKAESIPVIGGLF